MLPAGEMDVAGAQSLAGRFDEAASGTGRAEGEEGGIRSQAPAASSSGVGFGWLFGGGAGDQTAVGTSNRQQAPLPQTGSAPSPSRTAMPASASPLSPSTLSSAADLAPASDARQAISAHAWTLLSVGRLGALGRLRSSVAFLDHPTAAASATAPPAPSRGGNAVAAGAMQRHQQACGLRQIMEEGAALVTPSRPPSAGDLIVALAAVVQVCECVGMGVKKIDKEVNRCVILSSTNLIHT